MNKKFVTLYLLILTLEIIAGEMNYLRVVYFLKPAILSSLILLVSLKGFAKNRWFIAALFFSLLGDILLMVNLPNLFVFGLGSFLMTHLFYINIFRKKASFKPKTTIAFLTIIAVFFFAILNNKIPEALTLPVIVYMLIITLMGITLNSTVVSDKKIQLMLGIGAILFIVSDSLIAVNKFVTALPFPTLLIMSTYGVAQLLITNGYLRLFKTDQST